MIFRSSANVALWFLLQTFFGMIQNRKRPIPVILSYILYFHLLYSQNYLILRIFKKVSQFIWWKINLASLSSDLKWWIDFGQWKRYETLPSKIKKIQVRPLSGSVLVNSLQLRCNFVHCQIDSRVFCVDTIIIFLNIFSHFKRV